MEDFLRSWGYLGVFLGILATGVGFPMPEELPIVIGGALAGSDTARWWIMLPVCIVGVVVGDGLLYGIGRLWGPRLLQYAFIKKRLLPPERLLHIEKNFQQYGVRILLFARMTPGIRAPIFFTAGLVRLSLARFLLADGIYAIPGVSLLFFLGYWFTESMVTIIKDDLEKAKAIIIVAVIVAFVAYVTYRVLRRGPVVTGDPAAVTDIPFLGAPVTMIIDPDALKKQVEGDRPPAAGSRPPSGVPAPPAEGATLSKATERPEPASAKLPGQDADAAEPG